MDAINYIVAFGDGKRVTTMNEVKTEVYTTYIEGYDRTIVWQELLVGELVVQTAILGWYYGEPDDAATKQYSNSSVIAQYID